MSMMPKKMSRPKNWHPKAGAAEDMIEQLVSGCPMQLPGAYLDLLRASNGGYADLSASPWAVDFWAAGDVMRLNQEYGVDSRAPNFLAFGSNLGEEVLAFKRCEGAQSGVFLLPWHEPNGEYALKVADSFERLIEAIVEDGM
jgi:hypothetical protein